MHVIEVEFGISILSIEDVAYNWVTLWKEDKGENTTLISRNVFQIAFIDRFFPCEMRKAKVKEFMNLR